MDELWIVCITWNNGKYTEEPYNLERLAWARWSQILNDQLASHASFHKVFTK